MAEAFETFFLFLFLAIVGVINNLAISLMLGFNQAANNNQQYIKKEHKKMHRKLFSCRQFKFVSQTTPNFASLKGTQKHNNKKTKRMENNFIQFFIFISCSFLEYTNRPFFLLSQLTLIYTVRMEMLINSID